MLVSTCITKGKGNVMTGRGSRGLRARKAVVFAATVAGIVAFAAPAQATYPGKNGALAWEAYRAQLTNPPTADDKVETASTLITRCLGQDAVPPCQFGAPNYSPDGTTVVVSRRTPTDVINDKGIQGTLMLVDAAGGNERVLPRFTTDDQDPAFLPSANALLFDGRSSATAKPDLYSVTTAGTGLKQLLTNASQPAPCSNGSISFVRNKDVYLLSKRRRTVKRLTFRGGVEPSCAPNSQRVAFLRGSGLYTLGTNGKQLKPVHTAYGRPSYSPNGRSIAYIDLTANPRGYNFDIDVVDVQGHHSKTVKANVAQNFAGDEDPELAGNVAGTAWQSGG